MIDEDGNNIEKEFYSLESKILNAKGQELQDLKIEKARMLATARNCVDLTHKILLFLDNPSPATYETLKPIMSHDVTSCVIL